jgi:hypothetical protein
MDYASLTEEELDALIKGEELSATPAPAPAKKVVAAQPALPPTAEEIEPSGVKRGLAALGGAMQEPFVRGAEKLELMFPGATPEAAAATRQRVGAERSERMGARRELAKTPAGMFGEFAGTVIPAALVPQTVAAQMLTMGGLGFLTGGSDQPESAGSEAMSSLFSGGVDAAATGALMKLLQLGGKGVNAMRGKLTPQGTEALELDAAAARLGLPPTTIGQLDPFAPSVLKATPRQTAAQAEALEARMAGQRSVPNPTGGTTDEVVPGGKLEEGIKGALNVRAQQARDMYGAVDDFVTANQLGNVTPNYTVNTLAHINKQLTASGKAPTGNNLVFNLLDHYAPDAFAWLKQAGSPSVAKQSGMGLTQYHEARVGAGKALNSLDRLNPATMTDDQIQAKRMLLELKTALDNDAERWAKQNAGNAEAMSLYNRAKEFYSTTAADALMNPFARKAKSVTRGFSGPEQLYSAVIAPQNATFIDRLRPTASGETRDILRVLQDLPDVGRTVATRSVPGPAHAPNVLQTAGKAAGEVLGGPGLRWASTKTPAKRLYFAETPKGRWQGPTAQYPAGALETWAQEKTSTGR